MKDIVLNNISVAFGEKQVLKNHSAVFPYGKTTVVMGESGSGKTTLARMILGLLKPDSGEITGIPKKKSAVFQEDRLIEGYSVLSNFHFALDAVDKDKIKQALDELGLKDALSSNVSTLSGGMRRRVAIARAMLADSDLTVLDEPFKGLDEATKQKTMAYVKKCLNGKTAILITHDAEEAKLFSEGGLIIVK